MSFYLIILLIFLFIWEQIINALRLPGTIYKKNSIKNSQECRTIKNEIITNIRNSVL